MCWFVVQTFGLFHRFMWRDFVGDDRDGAHIRSGNGRLVRCRRTSLGDRRRRLDGCPRLSRQIQVFQLAVETYLDRFSCSGTFPIFVFYFRPFDRRRRRHGRHHRKFADFHRVVGIDFFTHPPDSAMVCCDKFGDHRLCIVVFEQG